MKRCSLLITLLVFHLSIALSSGQNSFNKETDLFIAQFDSLPDSDDIHSQAAVASFLAHPDQAGVNYFAVAGAYGSQAWRDNWDYIDSSELFELGFGREALPGDSADERAAARWVNSHGERILELTANNEVQRSQERIDNMDFASDVIVGKATPILEAGGKVFVMEAGQSDFSADWIEKLNVAGVPNTVTNVIIVQHSAFNQNYTSGGPNTNVSRVYTDGKDDWDYISSGAHNAYVKINDGNHGNNGTPDYQLTDTTFIDEAINADNPNARTRALWTLADEIAINSSYTNDPIPGGGVDFSDASEMMWIFGLADDDADFSTVREFWDAYVVNTPPKQIAYIHGDIAADGTVPSESQAPYHQMLLTDAGNLGVSEFTSMMEAEGFQIDQYYDQDTLLTADFLNRFEVVIFSLHQKIWSTTELEALDTWLNAGGGMLIYSDSASGGRFGIVGSDNPVGQTVTNNLIAPYGMQVTVDQAAGIIANQNPGSTHPVVNGELILEGEGVSPIAVDPNSGAKVLIAYDSDVVSGNPSLNRLQNITISNPLWAALANQTVGDGNVMVMYDRQPMWNNGPGSDIDKRDNKAILRNIIHFLANEEAEPNLPSPTGAIYQDLFDNDGLGTNAGIGGGLASTSIAAGAWEDSGALVYDPATDQGGNRATAYSVNGFTLTEGFALEVAYEISDLNVSTGGNRFSFGLVANYTPSGENPFEGASDADTYRVGFNLTNDDGIPQGLVSANGSGVSALEASFVTATGEHSLMLTVIPDGSGGAIWSYSYDNGSEVSGTIAEFDFSLPYHFVTHGRDDVSTKSLQSVTIRNLSPLVAHWSFDEGSGSVTGDETGNGYDGEAANTTWTAGRSDTALSFNSTSSSVEIPAEAFDTIENEISIAMWVFGSEQQPRADTIFYAEGAAGNRVLNIHLPWSNGKVFWDAGSDGNSYDRIDKAAIDSQFKGQWNHWVFTKNASEGSMCIYLNGALWHSETSGNPKTISGITTASIGSQAAVDDFYDGILDEVCLFNISLDAAGVQDLYASYSNGYDLWIAAFGLTGADALPDASANDGDGIVSLVEYILDGDPTVSDCHILPALSRDADGLSYTFTRRTDSTAFTAQYFQYSTDLVSWTDIDLGADEGANVTISPGTNGTQEVHIDLGGGTVDDDKFFVRLKVSL